ncbi:palmitoyl-protein thioesterase 1 [Diaphorina citri]|uniref:Palmitoyl-protein thioesterase 1 n=1 Tax=Diaphorina citri TaxID=121845 RepID=A0A3Q0IQD4_DIACI|nr:palmitoyl-protein thioesterase 1 [Diaphorina citri]
MKILVLMGVLSHLLVAVLADSPKYKPIVMWHGMGDSCCNPFSLGHFSKFLEEQMPTVYIKSLRIGNNSIEDIENGFFMNINDQVTLACKLIGEDPELKMGYNALGVSQGGLFLRAVAQRCPSPPMLNLISLGGPQQGVYGLPHCLYPTHEICDYLRRVLNVGAYWSWIQARFVQAEYWHDPMNEASYQTGSMFLADINNELQINTNYSDNLNRLRKLVLVKFTEDTMVQPKDSEWFGFYAPGQASTVLPLQKTKLYIEVRTSNFFVNIGSPESQEVGQVESDSADSWY